MKKRIIEFSENRIIIHRIIVAYNDDEELDAAIENSDGYDIDEVVGNIGCYVTVLDVDRDYDAYSDSIEFVGDFNVE